MLFNSLSLFQYDTVTARTLNTPAAPTNLASGAITHNSITLNWTKPAAAASYEVRRGSGTWTALGDVASYAFTGLTADTQYSLQVRAKNAGGTSAAASLSASTLPTAPGPPTGLTTSGITQTSITLNWTKPAGAASYEVRRGSGNWSDVGDVASYAFTGLTADTQYSLQVRAKNAGGTSAAASLNARTLPTAPGPPTGLTTSGITQTSITLNWTKPAGATGYKVRTGTTGAFTTLSDVATYTFTGLTANTAYTLQVRASNAGGDSSVAQTTATTNNVPPPPVPAAPTSLTTSGITQTSITLSWTKSTGAASYEVRRGSGTWTALGDVASYAFTGLTANTQYSLQVRAKNAGGTSTAASLSARTLATQSATPTPLPTPIRRPVPIQPSSGGGSSSKSSAEPLPTPQIQTLNQLPPGIQVNNWVDGAQGQQVDAVGVGRADVIPHDEILDALDVWGYVTPGLEVCFERHGRLLFVDSVYPPIDPYPLPAYQRAGMTCATINTAGTVVLLRSQAGAPPLTVHGQSQTLSDCLVKPSANLNFRQAPPDGLIIGGIWQDSVDWLRASERSFGYFKVLYDGSEGWVSGDYVLTRGNCGA